MSLIKLYYKYSLSPNIFLYQNTCYGILMMSSRDKTQCQGWVDIGNNGYDRKLQFKTPDYIS